MAIFEHFRFATYRACGDPDNVISLESAPSTAPGTGELCLAPVLSPVNPADLNIIAGTYPLSTPFGRPLGNEGVGTVLESASGVEGFPVGSRCIVPGHSEWWTEEKIVSAADAIVVPATIPDEIAATLSVNVATAWRLLHDFATFEPGDWLVQNAANSAVGRSVVALAAYHGIRTANIVRTSAASSDLTAMGATAVITADQDVAGQLREHTGDRPVRLALNAVGGRSAHEMAKVLAPGGQVVTYGAMAREPVPAANGLMIFNDIAFRGFWISRWYQRTGHPAIASMFAQIFTALQDGQLQIPICRRYPLDEVVRAVEHGASPGRSGKVMIAIGG